MIRLKRLRYCVFTVRYVRFAVDLVILRKWKKKVIVIVMLHSALSSFLPSTFDTQNPIFLSPSFTCIQTICYFDSLLE